MPENATAPTDMSPLDDAVSGAWKETMLEQGVAEADLQRDERGRFVPREDVPEAPEKPAAEKAAPKEVAETAEPAKPAPKRAAAAAPVVLEVADPATLATPFQLKDSGGEELAIPKGLTIEFQAAGKARAEPLDRVVKLAQMGYYNHEREQRMLATDQRAADWEHEAATLSARVAEREQQMEALLRDPDYRDRAVAEYAQLQTPEQQAARLARERDEFRNDRQRETLAASGTEYYQTQIVPSLGHLVEALPHVSADEITTRLMPFVNRQKGPLGIVPPERYDAISQYFLTEIVPWAQQVDEHRAVERGEPSGRQQASVAAKQNESKDAELTEAKLRAQRARRIATANLRPPGRGATPTPAKPQRPLTHSEIMEDVIQSAKAAAFGG